MATEEQETAAIKPLSPVSQLFVSPSLYCFIIFTLGFETRCNPSSIVEGIKKTWIKLPRFSSKVEMKINGNAVWVPISVRVEDHVIVPDLDFSNIETIVKRIFGHTTLTFSNVMGPDEEISFFDHPMSYVAASALGGPQALIIHYVSYVNKIIINLAVDTTVIPDPYLLCDDLVESLDIIKHAVLGERST